ncbi:MAG: Rrf2 family transcriptional regulator [Flavobacteriales bacterium]
MLNMRTKYGLHALLVLARAQDEGPLSAATIAERAHVPVKFLEAILLDLRKAGMTETIKGRHGGHQLRLRPAEIETTEVVRLFNGAIALVPCVSLKFYARCEECADEATCAVRDVFLAIRVATVRMLKAATLADLLKREDRLRKAAPRGMKK